MQEERKPRVIVAHPSKQHSFYTATALKREGILFKYITTVYDKKSSLTNRLKNFLKGKDLAKANTRKCNDLDDADVEQFCEFNWLISLLLNRYPRLNRIREYHRRIVTNKFGKKVANYAIKNCVDAVIMYDTTAMVCFRILKKKAPQIKLILDVSIATRPYMRKIFEKDIITSQNKQIRNEQWVMWDKRFETYLQKEMDLSDAFLSPSNFVKNSLISCGQNNIYVVPYGIDTSLFTPKQINYSNDLPLKLIYVGQVNHRKGIHHLLKVVSEYNSNRVILNLCGCYDKSSALYKDYSHCENIHFRGFVNKEQLSKEYQSADAFIIPTLGEGMAQVGIEALACGLPVLCTPCSGVNDLIIEGVNGYVFSESNNFALKEIIDKCIDNIEHIRLMCFEATKTGQKYSLDLYHKNLVVSVYNILGENA